MTFKPVEYLPSGKVAGASTLRKQVAKLGIRELMPRTGFSQHTIEAIRDGKQVCRAMIRRMQIALGS